LRTKTNNNLQTKHLFNFCPHYFALFIDLSLHLLTMSDMSEYTLNGGAGEPDMAPPPNPVTLFKHLADAAKDGINAIASGIKGTYNISLQMAERESVLMGTTPSDWKGTASQAAMEMVLWIDCLQTVLSALAGIDSIDSDDSAGNDSDCASGFVEVKNDDDEADKTFCFQIATVDRRDNSTFATVAHIVLNLTIACLNAQAAIEINRSAVINIAAAAAAEAYASDRANVDAMYRLAAAQYHAYVVRQLQDAGWPYYAEMLRRPCTASALQRIFLLPNLGGHQDFSQWQLELYVTALRAIVNSCTAVDGIGRLSTKHVMREYTEHALHIRSKLDAGLRAGGGYPARIGCNCIAP
jgi:hypothetical protein